jgi:NAD(P)-dependent dehydrogenase (short-subunit alcohol dehydrogenase family)
MAGACAGKVALVTGASEGSTGAAIAVRMAAEGARVAIAARSVHGLDDTLSRIHSVGGTGLVLPVDLADRHGARTTLVERTEDAFGQVDILVNNAALSIFKAVDLWTVDELEHCAQINLWAPWLLMTQVIPGMRRRGRGWILNLTSVSGELPPGPPFAYKAKDGSAAYAATKAALNRLTIAAAGENEGTGVAVNALTPQVAIDNARTVSSSQIANARQVDSPQTAVDDLFEPLETMAEAALVLCTGDPDVLTGRIAYSLQPLLELGRPVRDLRGRHLVKGWQPDDLPAAIDAREVFFAGTGWPRVFDFHRPSTPRPAVLR